MRGLLVPVDPCPTPCDWHPWYPKLDNRKELCKGGIVTAVAQALTLHKDKSNTIDDICRTLRVGRSTLYRYLTEEKQR